MLCWREGLPSQATTWEAALGKVRMESHDSTQDNACVAGLVLDIVCNGSDSEMQPFDRESIEHPLVLRQLVCNVKCPMGFWLHSSLAILGLVESQLLLKASSQPRPSLCHWDQPSLGVQDGVDCFAHQVEALQLARQIRVLLGKPSLSKVAQH